MSLIKSFPTLYPRLSGHEIADQLSVVSDVAIEALSIRLSLTNALLNGNEAQAQRNVLDECSRRYGLFRAHGADFFAKTSSPSNIDALEIALLMGDDLPTYVNHFYLRPSGHKEAVFVNIYDDQTENPIVFTDIKPSIDFLKRAIIAQGIYCNDPKSVEGDLLAHIHTIENANHRENTIYTHGTTEEEAHLLHDRIAFAKAEANLDTTIGQVLFDRLNNLSNTINTQLRAHSPHPQTP